MKVEIYTDGSSKGNPGPGGYGTILIYDDKDGIRHEKTISGGYKNTTNNRMEILAAIIGLEALNKPCNVTIYSDSQYLVKAFNEKWIDGWIKKRWTRGKNEPVKNVDLWKRLLQASKKHKVEYVWVKGHDGNKYNEKCDYLATKAADGPNYLEDI